MKWSLPEFGKREADNIDAIDGRSEREVVVSDEFLSSLDSMDPPLRERSLQTIRMLANNPAHPSLNAHKIRRAPGKWECYVTDKHRLIYDSTRREIRLWRIGAHSIIDQVHHLSFSPHTPFRRLESSAPPETAEARVFEIPAEWLERKETSGYNPFALIPAPHLRILGVPAHLVSAVRAAPSAEEATELPGLPDHTREWLLELLTNPHLADVIYDPSRLLFRTTLDRLEGYCQGRLKRLMLNLEDDQRVHVNRSSDGPHLLRGCAGSGKTTVALYRAIKCAESGEKTFFLTFNRTLANAAQTLMEELIGPLPSHLQVRNIDRWLFSFLRTRGIEVSIIDEKEQKRILEDVMSRIPDEESPQRRRMSADFIKDEIARVIKSNGLTTEQEYLSIRRYGRETALRAKARAVVWKVYEAYQQEITRMQRMDLQDLVLRAHEELHREPLDKPFSHVIIDEAQDLTAMHIRVAVQLMRADTVMANENDIFLVGDVSQTLYTRGFSWRQAGLQLQGRSSSLRRNYRNTKQIAEAAASLNSHNQIARTSEDYVDPESTQRQGPTPFVLKCDVKDREFRAVGEKILNLAGGNGFRISDFAVICPTNRLCDDAASRLLAMEIPVVAHRDDSFDILAEAVKILTIHSAKGLEFPVVFVLGLHEGLLPRTISTNDDDERTEHLEQERTILYVAMTRAAEALYLVTSEPDPSRFLAEVKDYVREECFAGAK